MFGDDLAVRIDVARRIENDRDHGEPLDRGRSQRLKAGGPVETVFQWLRDQDFNLLRREPGCFGLDCDLRRSEFGKDVVFRLLERVDAVQQDDAGERDDDAVKTDREPKKRCLRSHSVLAHCGASSPTWTWARNSSERSVCAP